MPEFEQIENFKLDEDSFLKRGLTDISKRCRFLPIIDKMGVFKYTPG
jgi:hypothetical protein